MRLVVPLICFILVSFSACASYDGFKVYKVLARTETDNAYLQSLKSNPNFDFWSKVNKVGKPVTVMVAPESQEIFESFLTANKINFDVHIENVETILQAKKKYHRSKKSIKTGGITFDQYLRHDEMNAYLAQLGQNYPDTVTVVTIGQSFENRDLNVTHISSGPRDPPKPIIFVDGGIHAREWVAPAVALYLINQLVENPANSDLIEDVDWVILPSLNPDGYEFSWDEDPLWRKTLSKGTRCDGCDANRNFDFHWMEVGADSAECSDIYAGKFAFSESETRSLAEYLNSTENIAAYLTLHSFGEYLLYPWGYVDELCDNWQELDTLAHAMNDAITAVSTRGTNYTIGETTATLYAAAGGSDDWSMGVAGIDIVYTMELPGGGDWGFDLPESELQEVVAETFEGLRVFGKYVAENRK